MQKSSRAARRVQAKHALATVNSSRRGKECTHTLRSAQMNTNVPKNVNRPMVTSAPTLRTSPAVQTQIIKLHLAGHSFVEIARQLHRDRRTVAKICRMPDVQAKVAELRERLLAEADDWAKSINFAVKHELDGRLAYRLLQAFGAIPAIPSRKQNVPRQERDLELIDAELLAKARVLGQVALERGSSSPLEANELELEPAHAQGD